MKLLTRHFTLMITTDDYICAVCTGKLDVRNVRKEEYVRITQWIGQKYVQVCSQVLESRERDTNSHVLSLFLSLSLSRYTHTHTHTHTHCTSILVGDYLALAYPGSMQASPVCVSVCV